MRMRKALLVCLLLVMRLAYAIDDTVTVVDGITSNIGAFSPSGTNNLLIVTNGGFAIVSSIANQSGGRSNAVFVVGAGSILSNSIVAFSAAGLSNALVVRDGGSLARNLTMGGTNNLLLIENSKFPLPGMTMAGRSNTFILNNSGIATASCQINTIFGQYLLNHSQWTNSDFQDFQASPSRSNLFVLSGGSVMLANNWQFWGVANRFQVTDPGSLWKVT